MNYLRQVLRSENIGGDLLAMSKALEKGALVSAFGCSAAEKAYFTSVIPRFVLYIVSDISQTERVKEAFLSFGRRAAVLPEREDIFVLSRATSAQATRQRLAVLDSVLCGDTDVLVVTPESLVGYVPRPVKLKERTIVIKRGEEYDLYKLSLALVAAGFRREEGGAEGTFLSRGDILDIFITGGEAYRIEFFGDTAESIKQIDRESFSVLKKPDKLRIIPVTDILVDKEIYAEATAKVKREKLNAETEAELVSRLTSCDNSPSMGFAIPYIKEGLGTVVDYLESGAVVVFDEIKPIDNRLNLVSKEQEARVRALVSSGEAGKAQLEATLKKTEAYDLLKLFSCLTYQQITSQNPAYDPTAVFSFKSIPISKYYLNTESLERDVKQWRVSGYRVAVCAGSADTARVLKDSFCELNIGATIANGELAPDFCETVIVEDNIAQGFLLHCAKLVVIGTDEILARRGGRVKVKKKELFTLPEVGDFVVHEFHGIGRCDGIVKLPSGEFERDYIEVSYRGNDKLYVPVENMNLLSRYAGGESAPKLSKMGGAEFEKVKERVRASVKEMAVNLLKLYKERENSKGYKYSDDTVFQTEFEDAFEFRPTDDQMIAIGEIKRDMEQGKIMDRLLVGDVGYGKTEVALRAAFKTVTEGKQVALLAPTTILCEQHFNTCKKRFAEWGLRIACVNRYRSASEISEIIRKLKEGTVDIICGTHRLLSADVSFKDLGLLILDEEQRFGVEQKEKIKSLKATVNVLSLSATPIPRTLHLSMSGIRDISVLETPPENRLPIETFVVAYSERLVIDAIRREMLRGGQTFILFNRVQGINSYYEQLKELVPEARIIVAHGQLDSDELEERIAAFYNREADVLVSTTIIENGIDLPSANTLVVVDADRLGLSSLYQLRGRVGRSDRLAYAYFTFREDKVLSETAYKRLSAIMDYTELGSGFKIAMRDLEIRGAGNVLGKEQHGHMEKVGYDMYCKLLSEAVGELSGKAVKTYGEVMIKSDVVAYVDEDYVVGNGERMRLYKRLAEISNREERKTFIDELTTLYGRPKQNTINLIDIAYIKNMATSKGVKNIVNTQNSVYAEFYEKAWKTPEILGAISEKNKCYMTASEPPQVVFNVAGKSGEIRNSALIAFFEDAVGMRKAN